MRNTEHSWMNRIGILSAMLFACAALAGCSTNQEGNVQRLRAGYDALAARQLDEAMALADEVLGNSPENTLPAEAHYLRGRVFEERAVRSTGNVAGQLQSARTEYVTALGLPHKPDLDGTARAGVANVAFHQDDYATALSQWAEAYPKLSKPEDKVLTLYQLGRTSQRLGKWSEADQYLASVQAAAPGTELATKAQRIQGTRGFIVQFATFSTRKQADTAIADLRTQGITAGHFIDSSNPALDQVRSGQLSTYLEAKALKARFAGVYVSAVILP